MGVRKTSLPEKVSQPGRPRSEAAHAAILAAGYKLLARHSVHSISAQQIASEAGVSTATLYRWWPTKEAVLLDAYLSCVNTDDLLRTGGSPLERLRQHTIHIGQLFEGEHGRITVRLLMAIQEDEALRQQFFDRLYRPKTDLCMSVLKEAVQKRELPKGTDIRLFLDTVFGILLMRLVIRQERFTNEFIESAFDFAVAAATNQRKPPVKPGPKGQR